MSQIVVITGAGAGVGRATARAFAAAGYDVGLRFDSVARTGSWEMFTDRHRGAVVAGLLAGLWGLHKLAKRLDV